MILLNQPWSVNEKAIELERRRLAVRRAGITLLWVLGVAFVAFAAGLMFPR